LSSRSGPAKNKKSFKKWTQRYEIYKELQKKIDEKLDYESKENDEEIRGEK